MVTNEESTTKEYHQPQLIKVGDAIETTLGRGRGRRRDRRSWYPVI